MSSLLFEQDRPPLTPKEQREQDTYDRYRRKFGEDLPTHGLPLMTREQEVRLMEDAIKKGERVSLEIPPDAYA